MSKGENPFPCLSNSISTGRTGLSLSLERERAVSHCWQRLLCSRSESLFLWGGRLVEAPDWRLEGSVLLWTPSCVSHCFPLWKRSQMELIWAPIDTNHLNFYIRLSSFQWVSKLEQCSRCTLWSFVPHKMWEDIKSMRSKARNNQLKVFDVLWNSFYQF